MVARSMVRAAVPILVAFLLACSGEVSTPGGSGDTNENTNDNSTNTNGNNTNTNNNNANEPTCSDGVQNGDETDTDCGGDMCALCDLGSACLNASDCGTNSCVSAVCVSASCDDGTQNGLETAIDCGGPQCAPCATGACTLPGDCASRVCVDGSCVAASCSDGVLNQDETGIDCGGACLSAASAQMCAVDQGCLSQSDCESGVCQDGSCRETSCDNGFSDGFETGLDCGGTQCGPCEPGGGCSENSDCISGVCGVGNSCEAATCSDGVLNQDEVDTDCGGTCGTCADGASCATGADCSSGSCRDGTCRAVSCGNGTQDGDETDVDCGGSCSGCATGDLCNDGADCANLNCDAGTCLAASCSDGLQNGDESGVDCGGLTCESCGSGVGCVTGYDCASGICRANGTCAAATCTDTVQNGTESDVDCGGSCGACDDGEACSANTDCASGTCASNLCLAPSCTDSIQNGAETDVDCGGGVCGACEETESCAAGTDCNSGLCVDERCVNASCTNAALDGDETDVDCGGSCVPCDELQGCGVDADCASGSCTDSICDAATCSDGIQNQDELAPDCGGVCLVGCEPGTECTASDDCASQVCSTGRCQEASCTDGVANGDEDGKDCGGSCPAACPDHCTNATQDEDETGVDCGGADCALCDDGDTCDEAANCASGLCAAGVCLGACPAPLVACGGECVDITADAGYCGSCTTSCSAGFACLAGSCSSSVVSVGPTPGKCADGGPPIVTGEGGGADCAGDLAAVTFRWGLCTCDAVDLNQEVFVDGFDSTASPYRGHCASDAPGAATDGEPCSTVAECSGTNRVCVDGIGAGLGTNGYYANNQTTVVYGTMWAANEDGSALASNGGIGLDAANLICRQEVYSGADWAGVVDVAGDAFVEGDSAATGTIQGDITLSGSVTGSAPGGSVIVDGALDVGPACDCNADQFVDVMGIVERHACAGSAGSWTCPAYDAGQTVRGNDNALIGLDPSVFDDAGGYLELDCGYYYLDRIFGRGVGPVTIKVNGNVALFVGQEIDTNSQLSFIVGPNANLDLFVSHEVCVGNFAFGSPLRPANARLYVAGGVTPSAYLADPDLVAPENCGGGAKAVVSMPQKLNVAGNVYTLSGLIDLSQDALLYGSLFGRQYNTSQQTTIHFDTAVLRAGDMCSACGDGTIDLPDEECDSTNLGGKTCVSEGYDGGALLCTPQCMIDETGCGACGDGVINGSEECDGSDLGEPAATCPSGDGTVSCASDCTLDTSLCVPPTLCDNGTLNAGEECDPDTSGGSPQFAAGFQTCEDLGQVGDAVLTCNTDCTVDNAACTFCGDGVLNGAEACDGADFGGEDCVSQTGEAGTLVCNTDCTINTSGCGQCTDCRDCNNQACNSGTCGACATSADCCAPLKCFGGQCIVY